MTNTLSSIALAIFIAEGGTNAAVPYGVLSIPVRNEAEARQICERTIANTQRRWQAAGRPGCFYDFLGNRYVGSNDPQGRVNWRRNVRSLLNHQRCNCRKP